MLANKRRPRVVNMHEAKTHLSELVEAAERGEAITIARRGEPAAFLVSAKPKKARAPAGLYRGHLRIGDDFNEPISGELSGISDE